MKKCFLALLLIGAVSISNADLNYTFDTDVEGFQNVSWQSGTVQQTHTAGGWQMMITKEFSWGAGGGSDNQQLAMQAAANSPGARISFDVSVDGSSFVPGVGDWYQIHFAGNSDGAAGWTQTQVNDSWHNADDSTLLTWHIDLPFSALGWEAGDQWFQIHTGTNSGGVVKAYIDNVVLTPEPATLAMLGLGALALLRKKK